VFSSGAELLRRIKKVRVGWGITFKMEKVVEQLSNVSIKADNKDELRRTVFPPPTMWYRSTIASARDDMWAYSAGGMIVIVQPQPTRTDPIGKVDVKVEGVTLGGNDGDGSVAGCRGSDDAEGVKSEEVVGDAKQKERGESRWPTFSIIGEQRNRYTSLSFCQSPKDFLPIPGATLVSGCKLTF
jgi:hypothetical protein